MSEIEMDKKDIALANAAYMLTNYFPYYFRIMRIDGIDAAMEAVGEDMFSGHLRINPVDHDAIMKFANKLSKRE